MSRAQPTLTHMALTALWARGTLKFVVSQNCDGLHVRAGLPRRALAELHGNMFAERCAACRRVYLRAFDTTERTARHAHGTRRLCHGCGAELHDSIVHFGERGRAAWPLNWAGALRHAAAADVVLCLGSSLKVLRRYPRLWRMQCAPHARPALYIVNLQWTPKDAVAQLKINARCDDVMAQVARRLRLRVPRYSPRRDPLLSHAVPLHPAEAHTTRRPALGAPSSPSEDDDDDEASSPSASDSDEDLPLRRLAERLRPPRAPCDAKPPPELLHAFQVSAAPSPGPGRPVRPADAPRGPQVSLCGGDATILLRAQHAPSVPASRPEPRPPSELRRFRMARPAGAEALNGSRLRHLLQFEPRLAPFSPPRPARPAGASEELAPLKRENGPDAPKEEPGAAEAHALAAAIIARTVLLCRAQLYPGLHTILAPSPPPQCAWCLRLLGRRRCQWYGPPAAPAARAWRRLRARRCLCACCGDGAPALRPDDDGGGWYGKGYRKGRRRRR